MTPLEFITLADLVPIIPEIIVLVTACTVLLVDLYAPQKERAFTLAVTTIIGLLLAIISEVQLHGKDITGYYVTTQNYRLRYNNDSVFLGMEAIRSLEKAG